MPSHFGRFRVLNDTPEDNNRRVVKQATFKIGTPEVLHTVVGFGTQFPELPEQYYAELGLEQGMAQADSVKVDLELYDPANPLSAPLTITDWELKVADAVLLTSVDIKVLFRSSGPEYRARATVAGDNYAFEEPVATFA